MSSKNISSSEDVSDEIKKEHNDSLIRRLLDSPFILLFLSLLIVFTSYTLWGIVELYNVPPGILPR